VSETLTQLDTLNKTATVRHSQALPARPGIKLQSKFQKKFCDSQLRLINNENLQTVDLGHQIIEGFDARGVRITMQPLGVGPNGESLDENVREKWCSDDLAAVVLQTTEDHKSGSKSSDAMKNLQRQEPDPSLFQIPHDYTVADAIPDPQRFPPGARVLP
jgi:hypothetical protein